MAVSWYTATIRRFSDPTKHARLYHALSPLTGENPVFTYDEKEFSRIHEHTKTWAKAQIIAGIRIYNTYHQTLLDELPKLKGKNVIFLPGDSVDQAVSNHRRLCVDYACERNRLTEEILLGIRELQEQYGWNMHDEFHFIQVSPVVLPFHTTSKCTLEHSLQNSVTGANNRMQALEKNARLGNTLRDPLNYCFSEGILQYAPGLFNSSEAKEAQGRTIAKKVDKLSRGKHLPEKDLEDLVRLFGEKINLAKITQDDINTLLEKSCAYNIQLMANAYATVCRALELKEISFYGPKTSAELGILKKSARILDIPVDAWGDPNSDDKTLRGKGVMTRAKESTLGAADCRAIKLLIGRLYNAFETAIGHMPEKICALKPIKQKMPVESLPKPCPYLSFYRCKSSVQCLDDHAQATDEGISLRVKNCAHSLANNLFTEQDIEEVFMLKYGKSNAGAVNAVKRLFEELKTKKIRFVDDRGKAREATELQILREDMREQGFTFTDIETDLELLSEKDAFISMLGEKGAFRTRSWQRFLGDKRLQERLGIEKPVYKIIPFYTKPDIPESWSIRPSEFSSKCYVARLLSKIDKSKLPEEILPHQWSVAGTTRHRLALWRPWKDYQGRKEPPVWEYTENELWAEFSNPDRENNAFATVIAFGHADATALLTNGNPKDDIPVILDYKRSPNEKPSYTIQEWLYKCGLERSAGRKFTNGAVLVVVNRPHFADPDESKFPIYHIVYVPEGEEETARFIDRDPFELKDAPVQGLGELVCRSYSIQRQMVLDKKVYFAVRENECSKKGACHARRHGNCGHHFNKQICSVVKTLLEKGENIENYFLPGLKF